MATPPAGEPEATRTCPRCGAASEPLQEYCLECGLRLPPAGSVTAEVRRAVRSRVRGAPADWVWPVLIGLAIAIAATAAAIAFGGGNATGSADTLVATNEPTVGRETKETVTIQPPEFTGRTTTAEKPTTREKPPTPPRVIEWPRGKSGYTVFLFSLPKSAQARTDARAKARAALDAGLEQVGVLDSSQYSSLHPGYYVVFAGVYGNGRAAQAGRERAQAAGYEAAYVRQITR